MFQGGTYDNIHTRSLTFLQFSRVHLGSLDHSLAVLWEARPLRSWALKPGWA